MRRRRAALALLGALALAGCEELVLSLPRDDVSGFYLHCEEKPPIGECAPRGALVHKHFAF